MAFPVGNKTALVTGGGSGICLAFTKLLLSHNCNVLIADLKLTPEAEEVIAGNDCEAGMGRVLFKKTDVTDWKELQAAFDTTLEEFGHLDIVCPGAGIIDPVFHLSSPASLNSPFLVPDFKLTCKIALVKFLALERHHRYN
jgi:3-hydroxybutyrate dehydrogenase